MKKYYFITGLLLLLSAKALNAQNFCNLGWAQLGTGTAGLAPTVRALHVNDTNTMVLYAGGNFTSAGSVGANHIAVWHNNSVWSSIGNGTNNEVDAIAIFKNKLYAGGMFDSASGILTHYIASWDSTQGWDSVLGGLNGNVYALKVFNGALYAGGSFTMSNGIKAHRIAKWNGTAWDSVGAGFDSNTVYALAVYNDTLYAGGSFTKSAGQTVNYIAKWNGTKWISVNGGMNNTVYALDSCRPYYSQAGLFAGGAFTQAGSASANHIAVLYFPNQWNALGPGTNDTVRALCQGVVVYGLTINKQNRTEYVDGPYVLIGGKFTTTGSINSHFVGFWDGTGWDYYGQVNGPVFATAANSPNYITGTNFIGGTFDTATDLNNRNYLCNNVASLNMMCGGGFNELSNNSSISIYPNPSNGVFTLQVKSEKVKVKSTIEIYNMLGEKVFFSQISIPTTQISINQPSGVYLCRVVANDGAVIGSSKIIIK